uniref:Protein Wnt n=2 Tax=Schistosoma japonicum TaxID=6182 RepID=A6XBT5_SCHJA|nr:signaling protein wnt10a [Schistosoma japonicum]
MKYKFLTICLHIMFICIIRSFIFYVGFNMILPWRIMISVNGINSGSWVFDLLMLNQLKKLNSPLKIHENYFNQLKDTHENMYSTNFINLSNRKLISASTSEIPTHHFQELPVNYHQLNQQNTDLDDLIHSFLSIDTDLTTHEISICHTLSGLTNSQRYICLQHSGLIWAMLEGTHLSMHECVHQFKHEQWNCSAVNLLYRTNIKSSFIPSTHGLEGILQRGSRETAFLSSSWSAGVVQAITRACSRGQMGTCDCDPHRREGQGRDAEGIFTWGGCSDPIPFGMRLARLFLDANDEEHRNAAVQREHELHEQRIQLLSSMRLNSQDKQDLKKSQRNYRLPRSLNKTISHEKLNSNDKENDKRSTKQVNKSTTVLSAKELQAETLRIIQTKARALMNLHNRKAGRRLIWKNRVTKCKCHGVSGACSMRTCWQRVNEFRLVGMMLKAAYDSAIRVTYEPRLDILKRISTRINPNAYERLNQNKKQMTRKNSPVLSAIPNHDSKNWLVLINNNSNSSFKHDHSEFSNNNGRLQRRWPRMVMTKTREIPKNHLVYLEESPNYCYFDETIGHLGIAGRQCNATSNNAVNSCTRLCCDRGYDTLEFEREQKCECKFFWCCEVRCNICRERIVLHHCKH